MRVFRVAAMIALWTGQAYKESLKKIPDAKAANDPWGAVRSTDAAKTPPAKAPPAKAPPAKTTTATKSKTKTSSAPN